MARRRDDKDNASPHGALRYVRSHAHLNGLDRTGARGGRDDVGGIEQETWRGRDEEMRRMHSGSAAGSGAAAGAVEPKRSRADQHVRDDVCEELTVHNVVDATAIEVDVKDGVVTLSGTVSTREERRLAEDVVYDVPDVVDVVNTLRVVPRDVVAPFER